MREITSDSALEYLRQSGPLAPRVAGACEVRELAGGVSNVVLLVTPQSGEPFVVKQARGRLRVKDEWLCPVERIWREVEVLRLCGGILTRSVSEENTPTRSVSEGLSKRPPACKKSLADASGWYSAIVPDVLWEDRENYLYAMTAAPAAHRTWKELLLAGELESSESIARACGELLAALHAETWQDAAVAAQLDDRTYFDQLRVDPYYRQLARVDPALAPQVNGLIDSVWNNRRSLVHGDYSPKNLLVWPGHVMLIDFEVGHYGDPAFDLGFFLTHLVLKSIRAAPQGERCLALGTLFWNTYRDALAPRIGARELAELEQRALLNLAGCTLARIDGKSPVDYLQPQQQALVRGLAQGWLRQQPQNWQAATIELAESNP